VQTECDGVSEDMVNVFRSKKIGLGSPFCYRPGVSSKKLAYLIQSC